MVLSDILYFELPIEYINYIAVGLWDFPTDNGFPNDGTLRYSLFWIADWTFNYIAAGLCWREASQQGAFEGGDS